MQSDKSTSQQQHPTVGKVSTEFSVPSSLRTGAGRTGRAWLIALVLSGLIVYFPTFYGLAVSCTGGDSYYAHWFLIPPVSAMFVWMKRDTLSQLPVHGSNGGLALVAASLLLHVLAVWFRVDFVSAFALVATVWGLALYFLGKRIVRELSFPLVFLFFMVPLPGTLISPLAFHMKILSGKIAVGLYGLFGGTAIITGSKIVLGEGDPLWMGYECSGLKSIISLSSLGAAIAYLVRTSRPRKVVLFLSSFPLAILSNSIRVASLCFAANQWGVKSKAFKTFHDVSSPVVFAIMLAGLLGICKLLSIGDKTRKSQLAGPDQPKPPASSGARLFASVSKARLSAAVGFFAVSAILVALSPHSLVSVAKMSSLQPLELPEHVGQWSAAEADVAAREDVFSVLKTKSIVMRNYRHPEGKEVQVLVVASDTDRQAFHPPEICMIGAGNEVLEHWQEPVDIVSRQAERLNLNTFVRGTSGRPDTLVLYWYMAGERSTGSRTLQQLILLLNGARKTPTVGAMIRLTVPLALVSRDNALDWAKDFSRSLVPLMPAVIKKAENRRDQPQN